MVEVCAAGSRLEIISIEIRKYSNRIRVLPSRKAELLRGVSTFTRILQAIVGHPKLKRIDFLLGDNSVEDVYGEVRDDVQCMRNRRVFLSCGQTTFLYGKGFFKRRYQNPRDVKIMSVGC